MTFLSSIQATFHTLIVSRHQMKIILISSLHLLISWNLLIKLFIFLSHCWRPRRSIQSTNRAVCPNHNCCRLPRKHKSVSVATEKTFNLQHGHLWEFIQLRWILNRSAFDNKSLPAYKYNFEPGFDSIEFRNWYSIAYRFLFRLLDNPRIFKFNSIRYKSIRSTNHIRIKFGPTKNVKLKFDECYMHVFTRLYCCRYYIGTTCSRILNSIEMVSSKMQAYFRMEFIKQRFNMNWKL